MTAIPHAAEALTSAFGRFERAATRVLGAATGAGAGDDEDLAASFVEMAQAKVQAKAAVATVRFSDAMWAELIDIGKNER